MKLHPRIVELSRAIEHVPREEVLSFDTLKHLLKYGATGTEAAITMHLIYDIPLDDAWNYVVSSNIFSVEEINDSAMQTFTYMYYNDKRK